MGRELPFFWGFFMYRLICSDPVVLNSEKVQECNSAAGWIVQQVPEPFNPALLTPDLLAPYWGMGFALYLSWMFIEKPIILAVKGGIDIIKKINGDYH